MGAPLVRPVLRTGALAAALSFLAPAGEACESCREALAADGGGLGLGFNLSIFFMIGTMLCVLGGFALLVWSSYRSASARGGAGHAFRPDGKIRWSGSSD